MNTNRLILGIYGCISAAIFLIMFLQGWSTDNITHAAIITFFGLQFLFFPLLKIGLSSLAPKWRFVIPAVIFAAIVEGCYMISKPLDKSLIITMDMPIWQMLKNFGIDVLLTTPVYIVIFLFIWYLMNQFRYEMWEFILLMAAGQALGDGQAFFLLNPIMIIFMSYVMINYHAMQVSPYLLVQEELLAQEKGWKKYVFPLVGLPILYFLCGASVMVVGRLLGLLPSL